MRRRVVCRAAVGLSLAGALMLPAGAQALSFVAGPTVPTAQPASKVLTADFDPRRAARPRHARPGRRERVGPLRQVARAPSYPTQSLPVGAGASDATIADFNGDGLPDLAATSAGDNVVTAWSATAGGSFGARATIGTGGGPARIVAGDFDGDGKRDVAFLDGPRAARDGRPRSR